MVLPSALGGDDALFDAYDEFVPDHLPEPDAFLEGHDVLTGDDHLAFHRLTRSVFEERTVYDTTFGYNLARLNLDTRHTGAGYRYAREADDADVEVEDAREVGSNPMERAKRAEGSSRGSPDAPF